MKFCRCSPIKSPILAASPTIVTSSAESKLVSHAVHDQGRNWSCWAYAIATSIRGSLRNLISNCAERGIISQNLKDDLTARLDHTSHHHQMRCELMMIIMPRRVNTVGVGQTAYVHPVFRRV